MEPKRYWWILYGPGKWSSEICIDLHPFTWLIIYNKEIAYHQSEVHILNWKIISAEEYNLWNELNNKQ